MSSFSPTTNMIVAPAKIYVNPGMMYPLDESVSPIIKPRKMAIPPRVGVIKMAADLLLGTENNFN
jgi:hypothetical protein